MVREDSDGKYTPNLFCARFRIRHARESSSLRSSTSPVLEAKNGWEKYGMHARAIAPTRSATIGTSRQPRTDMPSSAARLSMPALAASDSRFSAGRKAVPTTN